MAISQLVRTLAPAAVRPPNSAQFVVPAVEHDRRTHQTVRLAYRDYRSTAAGEPSVVTLVHGSPGDSRVFEQLAATLSQQHRVIAPDLPGFGDSSLELPDYSLRAHARYVIDLLDHLRIARTHVVGFSMGGGVALNVSDLGKDRITSVVLLSGIGVQEMELLGNYYANHAVHGAQLGTLWLIREGVPHFGLLNHPLGVAYSYARNFYDSDQRPLRKTLSSVETPMLILHGQDDASVPVEAAFEHARLVAQSELHVLNQGHFMLFSQTAEVARRIQGFMQRVDRGDGISRWQALPHRVTASRDAFDERLIPRARGVSAAVLGGVIVATTLISRHLGVVGAGVLHGQGRSSFWLALTGSLVGSGAGTWLRRPRRAGRYLSAAVLRGAKTIAIVAISAFIAPGLLRVEILTGVGSWNSWAAVTVVLWLPFWALTLLRRRRALEADQPDTGSDLTRHSGV